MNRDVLEGKWKQFRGEVQRRWGRLTGDDLDYAEGNYDKLAGRLQERYGYSKERALSELDGFLDTVGEEQAHEEPVRT